MKAAITNRDLLRLIESDPYDVWVAHDVLDNDVPMWRVENWLRENEALVVFHKDTVFKLSNGVTVCY